MSIQCSMWLPWQTHDLMSGTLTDTIANAGTWWPMKTDKGSQWLVQANEGCTDDDRAQVCFCSIFTNNLYAILAFIGLTQANEDQYRPATANDDQHYQWQLVKTNTDQQKPTQAHDSQWWPTAHSIGQQKAPRYFFFCFIYSFTTDIYDILTFINAGTG